MILWISCKCPHNRPGKSNYAENLVKIDPDWLEGGDWQPCEPRASGEDWIDWGDWIEGREPRVSGGVWLKDAVDTRVPQRGEEGYQRPRPQVWTEATDRSL